MLTFDWTFAHPAGKLGVGAYVPLQNVVNATSSRSPIAVVDGDVMPIEVPELPSSDELAATNVGFATAYLTAPGPTTR